MEATSSIETHIKTDSQQAYLNLAISALSKINHDPLLEKGMNMMNKGHGNRGKFGHLVERGAVMVDIAKAAKQVQRTKAEEEDW